MKKVILLLVLIIGFSSCEDFKKGVKDGYNDAKTEADIDAVDITHAKDGLTTLSGEFSFYADAAVLQVGNSSIYGVVLNEKAETISKQAKAFQKEPTDMVKVEVLGELIPKEENEEGWPFKLKINKIINVSALEANKNNVIKLGN